MALVLSSTEQVVLALPGDTRLEPVEGHLDQLLDRAQAAGLPSEMIISKVREGLAKGVDAARIDAAATRLTENLESSQRYVAERKPGPPFPALVRAVMEARSAGVAPEVVDALVRNDRPDRPRAIEVVTDLAERRYPADRAAFIVGDVLGRDARSLDELPGTLETIRQDYILSHAEAVDALARGLAAADSLQAGYKRTVEDERRRGRGVAGKWSDGEGDGSPGRSGLAPGRIKARSGPLVPVPGRSR